MYHLESTFSKICSLSTVLWYLLTNSHCLLINMLHVAHAMTFMAHAMQLLTKDQKPANHSNLFSIVVLVQSQLSVRTVLISTDLRSRSWVHGKVIWQPEAVAPPIDTDISYLNLVCVSLPVIDSGTINTDNIKENLVFPPKKAGEYLHASHRGISIQICG